MKPSIANVVNKWEEQEKRHKERMKEKNKRHQIGKWDDTMVKYRVEKSYNGLGCHIYYGRKKIGLIGVNAEYARDVNRGSLKCNTDVFKLANQYPSVWKENGEWLGRDENGKEKGYKPAPKVWNVYQSVVKDEYHGKKIGTAMYKAAMLEIYKQIGPFIFVSHGCSSVGSTSDAAKRVWNSLARQMPSSGICLAVLKPPKLR